MVLGIGYVLGGGIEGDRKERVALDWAVEKIEHCETPYVREDFASVTDCLKGAIAEVEEDRREEARAEGYDPRR